MSVRSLGVIAGVSNNVPFLVPWGGGGGGGGGGWWLFVSTVMDFPVGNFLSVFIPSLEVSTLVC